MSERVVAEGIEAHLGERLVSARPMGGGCVGEVYRAGLSDGSTVVAKVDRTGGEGQLPLEGYMLRYLRQNSNLPAPYVYHSSGSLLLMEFVEGGGGRSEGAELHAAELMSNLHNIHSGHYGLERDTLIGGLHQPNPQTCSWVEFFWDQRLVYMARVAREAERLPDSLFGRIVDLSEKLDEFIEEPEAPSLIHGDIWGGNVLTKGNKVSGFLDPALYYADPEIELAFITLFGTFGDAFFRRYGELRGIRGGFFEVRRDIYNLYPLLVHVRLFGGGYVGAVESTLGRYGF